MDSREYNKLMEKVEQITSDILQTSGEKSETVKKLGTRLFSLSEKIVAQVETKKKISGKIQCSKGCSFCCYAQISATPLEALLVGNFIKENYSLHKTDMLMKRVANNIKLTKGKSSEERIDLWEQTPCIFLENNQCLIYHVRPFICRSWHSLSSEQCKSAFNSRNPDAEIDSTPYRDDVFAAVRQGLSTACQKAGCDAKPIEITIAIKTILNHTAPEEAWIKGSQLFR